MHTCTYIHTHTSYMNAKLQTHDKNCHKIILIYIDKMMKKMVKHVTVNTVSAVLDCHI